MEDYLKRLYNSLASVFVKIENNQTIPLRLKRSLFSCFKKVIDAGQRHDSKFFKKLGKVYEKYGTEMFTNSSISFICIVEIHKHLSFLGYEIELEENDLLSDSELEKSYNNTLSIDDLLENDESFGTTEINPYAKIITYQNFANDQFIIDTNGNLYTFGAIPFVEPMLVTSGVTEVNNDFNFLIGIDNEGKLWKQNVKSRFEKEIFYNKDVTFVKLASFFIDNRKLLFALTNIGALYKFIQIDETFEFDEVVSWNVKDISSSKEVFASINSAGKLFIMGDQSSLTISSFSAQAEFSTQFEKKIKKVFVYECMIFIIDENDDAWSIGINRNFCLGCDFSYRNTFHKINIREDIVDISSSGSHTLFLTKDGNVYGCGVNSKKELGLYTMEVIAPQLIFKNNAKLMEAGKECTFIVDFDGNMYAMGNNPDGRFGVKSKEINPTPLTINLLDSML